MLCGNPLQKPCCLFLSKIDERIAHTSALVPALGKDWAWFRYALWAALRLAGVVALQLVDRLTEVKRMRLA